MVLLGLRVHAVVPSQPSAGRSPRWRPRQGFTLLEVLVATGLSVLLMAAIVSAVDLYRKTVTAGRDDLAQAQLARAILQMMERDIRSVTFSPQEDQQDTLADGDPDALFVVEVDSTMAMFGESAGITGDNSTLVIHGRRPEPHTGPLAVGRVQGRAGSDLRSTAYFLTVEGGGGLPGLAAKLLAQRGDDTSGLARMEGDRLALLFADAAGDSYHLLENVRVLAAEVTWLRFRYFDEVRAYDVWDSAALGRLPRAIEVELGLRLDGDLSQEPTRFFRHVIAVAIAELEPAASSLMGI